MELAYNGKNIPKEWEHDPEIKNNEGHTVCYYLWDNGVIAPEEW